MVNGDFVARLILYHQEKDRALGIGFDTVFVRGLIAHCGDLIAAEKIATANYLKAAYLKSIIDRIQSTITAMVEQADTPDKRRAILADVVGLEAKAEATALELEQLANG